MENDVIKYDPQFKKKIIWKLILSSINSQKIRKFCVWKVMVAIVFNTKLHKEGSMVPNIGFLGNCILTLQYF